MRQINIIFVLLCLRVVLRLVNQALIPSCRRQCQHLIRLYSPVRLIRYRLVHVPLTTWQAILLLPAKVILMAVKQPSGLRMDLRTMSVIKQTSNTAWGGMMGFLFVVRYVKKCFVALPEV